MTENEIQAAAVKALNAILAPDECFVCAIPGGNRGMTTAPGYIAGIPDLFVVGQGGKIAFIELKTPTGRVSPYQKALHERMKSLQIPVAVCRSVDDCIDFVSQHFPTRIKA